VSESQDRRRKKKEFIEKSEEAINGQTYIKFKETKVDRYLVMYTE